MISALILFALIAHASGQCGYDMVPILTGKLPDEFNIGTILHLFINSNHKRGVLSTRDFKISGLDTVVASLHFCPVDMTIYGSLSASRLQVTGYYKSNIDYLSHGTEVFTHGDGFLNMTMTNFQLRNLVAPLRYSRVVKKMQIDNMEYDASEQVLNPHITGFQVDGEGAHVPKADEFMKIDQSKSCPSLIELVRAILNFRVKSGILLNAAKEMFVSAVAP